MRLFAFVLCVLSLGARAFSVEPAGGILLLAHGGSREWNSEVQSLRDKVNAKVPVEVALGMADPATLQSALDRLAARGIRRVVAVPLFVHTRSEVSQSADVHVDRA